MANMATQTTLKVADEVWIAAALLHRDHPDASDFAVEEIVRRAEREGLHKPLRRGVYVHVIQHCVANRPPNPGRYRMLFETGPGRWRLCRKGDSHHPDREGAKITPEREGPPGWLQRPAQWYRDCSVATNNSSNKDPLLSFRGSEKRFGLTSTRKIMYVACVRAGNESHFGDINLHLSVRGLWGTRKVSVRCRPM